MANTATTTITSRKNATDGVKMVDTNAPPGHHKGTSKAQYVGPPAIGTDGKVVPYPKRWGYSASAFKNDELRAAIFVLTLMITFSACNQTKAASQFYEYLATHYTLFQINFFGSYIVTTSVFTAGAAFFAFVDLTGRPRWFFKYKVQPFQRVDGREYSKIALVAVRNQTIVIWPLMYIRSRFNPSRVHPQGMEGFWLTMFNLLFNLFCTELGFYFIHRFFHTPFMYQRFHKQHHYMTAPVALASVYCSVTEFIFSNLLPNVVGISIMKPHWSIQLCTFCILSTTTLCAHSGYNVPFLYSSLIHDWHHFSFNENYGPTGLFDWLLGTSSRYHNVLQEGKERHRGDADKAREELLSKLAAWEANGSTSSSSASSFSDKSL